MYQSNGVLNTLMSRYKKTPEKSLWDKLKSKPSLKSSYSSTQSKTLISSQIQDKKKVTKSYERFNTFTESRQNAHSGLADNKVFNDGKNNVYFR